MSDPYESRKKARRDSNVRPLLVIVLLVSLFFLMGLVIPHGCPIGHGSGQGITKARQQASAIHTALIQYRTDYGKWPLAEQTVEQWETAADEEVYDRLIAVLAVEGESEWIGKINPRRTVYLEAAFNDDGLVVDPWGNRYRVMIDSDFDGEIPAPDGTVMTAAVLVWSLGPNGKDEAGAGDDLATWH